MLICLLFLTFAGCYIASLQFAQPSCAEDTENCPDIDQKAAPMDSPINFPNGCVLFQDAGKNTTNYTEQVVKCVTEAIDGAKGKVEGEVEALTDWVVTSLATIAILFLGFRMVGGDTSYKREAALTIFRIGFAAAFVSQFAVIDGWVMGAYNELMTAPINPYGAPWGQIDGFLDKLLQFSDSSKGALITGIVGLIGAAATSSTVGVMMFTTGMLAIVNVLLFVMKVVYTYLLAYLTLAFLLMFSVAVIPLVVLTQTDRFFKKWVALIISAALTPYMIFIFVGMMIGAFDGLISQIFDVFGGHDFRGFWRNNQPVFSWAMPSDPNINKALHDAATPVGCDLINNMTHSASKGGEYNINAPSQSFMNPFAKDSYDAAPGQTAGVDFGPNEVSIVQDASFAFISLWFFSSFMNSATAMIPQIASSIAGAATGISFGGGPVMGAVEGKFNEVQGKAAQNMSNDGSKFEKIKGQMSKMVGKR